jgi:hypothetical protein
MKDIDDLNRRQMLKYTALMTGGVLSASLIDAVLSGVGAQEVDNKVLSIQQMELVSEIAQMIIPDTQTLGAKAAKVDLYIHMMVGDWYTEDERQNFINGLSRVNLVTQEMFGKNFMAASIAERTKILVNLDAENSTNDQKTFLEEFKGLTLVGYFSSQIGAEQHLRYEQYPGPYQGCVAFEEVGRTWAT